MKWIVTLCLGALLYSPCQAADLQMTVQAPCKNYVGPGCPDIAPGDTTYRSGPTLSDLSEIRVYVIRFDAPTDTLKLSIAALGKECDSLSFNITFADSVSGHGVMGRVLVTAADRGGNEGCVGAQYVFAIPASDFKPGLSGEYFKSQDFTMLAATRIDPQVNFDWQDGIPIAGVQDEHFSVRWMGQLRAPSGGSYAFHMIVNDAGKLKIGSAVVFDDLATGDGQHDLRGTITLQAGTNYPIEVSMLEKTGNARCNLYWTQPGMSEVVIPPAAYQH